MDTDVALQHLGVLPPSAQLAEDLDRLGFAVVPNALDPDQLERVRERVGAIAADEGSAAGSEFQQEQGAARLSNLVDKGEEFEVFLNHPVVLGGLAHVLGGDLKLSSLNSRAALPGQGHQGLHADWDPKAGDPASLGGYQVCNSIWLLDDFTAENGATRAVPGTHRSGRTPSQVLADPEAPHPDQVLLLAPASTAVVFNSHLWHGGTLNVTDRPRRAIHSYWTRRHLPQQQDQRSFLRAETKQRLSPAVRHLLDV